MLPIWVPIISYSKFNHFRFENLIISHLVHGARRNEFAFASALCHIQDVIWRMLFYRVFIVTGKNEVLSLCPPPYHFPKDGYFASRKNIRHPWERFGRASEKTRKFTGKSDLRKRHKSWGRILRIRQDQKERASCFIGVFESDRTWSKGNSRLRFCVICDFRKNTVRGKCGSIRHVERCRSWSHAVLMSHSVWGVWIEIIAEAYSGWHKNCLAPYGASGLGSNRMEFHTVSVFVYSPFQRCDFTYVLWQGIWILRRKTRPIFGIKQNIFLKTW